MLFLASFSSKHQINIVLSVTPDSTAIHDQRFRALPCFSTTKMHEDKFYFDMIITVGGALIPLSITKYRIADASLFYSIYRLFP
jgi:hypothetical protein